MRIYLQRLGLSLFFYFDFENQNLIFYWQDEDDGPFAEACFDFEFISAG